MRRSVGTRPRSETTRTRRQREENAIRVYSRLFAVGYLMCPHPTKTQITFGHIFLKTLGKFLKPTSNPHYYKKTEFWKKCVQHNKTPISGYFLQKAQITKIFVDTSGFQNVSKTSRKKRDGNELDRYAKYNVSKPNTRISW